MKHLKLFEEYVSEWYNLDIAVNSIKKKLKRAGIKYDVWDNTVMGKVMEPKLDIKGKDFVIGIATEFHDQYTLYNQKGEELLHTNNADEIIDKVTESLLDEGAMKHLHQLIQQSKNSQDFRKQVYQEYGDKLKRNKETDRWLDSLYGDMVKESLLENKYQEVNVHVNKMWDGINKFTSGLFELNYTLKNHSKDMDSKDRKELEHLLNKMKAEVKDAKLKF